MQPNSTKSSPSFSSSKDSQSKLICKKCKHGKMLLAVEEGDLEYTDKFICQDCHHTDTIPTRDLLFSQILTGITGTMICVYLLIKQLAILFRGIQHDHLNNALTTSSLILVSAIFLSGFIFILFKAQEGLNHRRLYSKNKN
jgi:hypothetical protein